MKKNKFNHVVALLAFSGVLTGCGGSSDGTPAVQTYEVTVSNLTHNQPLSPLALVLHSEQTNLWAIGSEASVALEDLAESGSNTALLALDNGYLEAAASGQDLIMPGENETVTLSVSGNVPDAYLSLASMLVNTNDGFTGVTGFDVSDLSVGAAKSLTLPVYDAGTEANDERVNTIPGQMGEGFNAERLDSNKVSRHPGVVGNDDGYADSVLTSSHKFDHPAASLTITRLN